MGNRDQGETAVGSPLGPPSGRFAVVLTGVVGGVFLGAALLAPLAAGSLEAVLGDPELRFSRVFDRLAILILIVALVVFRRQLGLARIVEAWRMESWSQRGIRAVLGLAASLVPALLVMAPAIESSALLWAGRTALEAAEKMAVAIPSALFVAVIEEAFFRVVVFRGLAATWWWPAAAVVASAFYSVVHFLTPATDFVADGPSPVHGLRYLATIFGRLAEPATLAAVLGLFLIGLVLCLALQRGRSLAMVIGLHAGWFLAAKAVIRVTSLPPELAAGESMAKRLLMIGSPWMWLAIAATGVCVLVITRHRSRAG